MRTKICDRTLCQQNTTFSFKEKIEISRQLQRLCVDTVELPSIENTKTDILLIKTVASFVKDSTLSVCAGQTHESLQNALTALSTAAHPRIRIELPVSTVGMEYTCHKKAPQMLETVRELVKAAREKCSDVEFCAMDATRAEKDFLKEIILAAEQSGAGMVTVCDDAAEMMPDDLGQFTREISSYLSEDTQFGICASDKNGLAAANAVMALKNGASVIKTSTSGVGADLETVAGILKNCGAACGFSSDLKYTELHRIAKQIDWIITNAENEKSSVTVSEFDGSGIQLDKNDSRDAVISAVSRLGYDLNEEDCAKVYEEFLRVASKKSVGSKELEAVVASVALQVPPTYKLISYVINSGNIISATAQLTLERNGEKLQGICIGDGPVDASFLAIEQIIGHRYELDDFQIQAVTEGKEAMGSALVRLRSNGKLYSGNGISTDILGASIRAYINAVNKIVYEEVG